MNAKAALGMSGGLLVTIVSVVLLAAVSLLGLRASSASTRLRFFYILQSTGWLMLWALVLLMVGSNLLVGGA
jgi:hypothetical protein